jgi:putative hydrolase of the HAD superfamily
MDLRYVLMDVDGVIVPGRGSRFAPHWADKYGLTDTVTKSFFRGPFRQCMVGKADLRVELLPYFAQWEWSGNIDNFLANWFCCEHIVDSQVLAVMDRLRQEDVGVYLATNQAAYRIHYLQEHMDLMDHVDGVFASCMVDTSSRRRGIL